MTRHALPTALAVLALVCSAGCSRPSGGGLLDGKPSDTDADEEALFPPLPVIGRAACSDRAGCVLEGTLDAGWDRGRRLIVASIALPPRPNGASCVPREQWLLSAGARPLRPVQLLATGCTSEGMARPTLTMLSAGTLRCASSSEGSSIPEGFVWVAHTVDFSLTPPGVLRHEVKGWFPDRPGDCNGHDGYWDWREFRGEDRPIGPRCPGEASVSFPKVHVEDEAFLRDGWKTTRLGGCAMLIDGTPHHGFGVPAGSATASLRAVATQGDLFVEITDDSIEPSRDSLELGWSDDKTGDYEAHVWMDGRTDAKWLKAAMASPTPTMRRFRIARDDSEVRLTYEDADDRRVRAPRRLTSAEGRSFNEAQWIDPTEAMCVVRDGALEVERKTQNGMTPLAVVP